jgi:hypothetical protein
MVKLGFSIVSCNFCAGPNQRKIPARKRYGWEAAVRIKAHPALVRNFEFKKKKKFILKS